MFWSDGGANNPAIGLVFYQRSATPMFAFQK